MRLAILFAALALTIAHHSVAQTRINMPLQDGRSHAANSPTRLEDIRSEGIPFREGTAKDGSSAQMNPVLPEGGTVPFGIRARFQAKRCAHIVVSEAPDTDPKMVEPIARTFHSNMPRLQGSPVCCGDSGGRQDALRRVSAGPSILGRTE